MKKLIILLMAMLLFALASGTGAANEIFVQPGESIQTAVDNAVPGDVIIVKPGTYIENIRINKPDLVIRSESGKPEDTIIRINPSTHVFYVAAANTTISGFKIESGDTGVYLTRCNNCTVMNNDLSNNRVGIHLSSSNYNTILGNRANSNTADGIHLVNSERNILLNNIVSSNNHGIVLENAIENNLTGNIVNSNTNHGFYLRTSNGNILNRNAVHDNFRGINHISSNKSVISGNDVSNNRERGMWISQSSYNIISGNTANETRGGIYLDSSTDNTISDNIIANNNESGFYECRACRRNLFFNNYVNNDLNADINNMDTRWNVAKTDGPNIVGGPYIGGNFWAKPDGNGFSQTATDGNKDGFADKVYSDLQNVTDYLPLVPVSSPQQPVLPVADFRANVTIGDAPLSVLFNDLSQNAVSYKWDFESDGNIDSFDKSPVYTYMLPGNYTAKLTVSSVNGTTYSKTQDIIVQEAQREDKIYPFANFSVNTTSGYAPLSVQFTDLSQNATSRNWDIWNDGIVDSNESNLVYVFTSPGTYPVSLTATNTNGTSSKPVTITVMEQSSSNGGSSGGSSGGSHSSSGGSGGGGGGGSPEPAKNVQVKELSQVRVTSGKPVKFDFTKNATCVVYVSFDAKKTCGKTTTVAEQLKAKSTLVSNLSSGEVYKYFNLWVGNAGFATEKNIENPVVCFKVEKSWVKDQKIDQNSIALNRYNDKNWSQIPAKLLREDDKYLYFTAETPGFSFFAITGKASGKDAGTETKPATDTSEPEQNITTSEIEQEQKTEQGNLTGSQESGQESLKSTPGFDTLYAIVCLLIVFVKKRK